jgi:hypothetical protein
VRGKHGVVCSMAAEEGAKAARPSVIVLLYNKENQKRGEPFGSPETTRVLFVSVRVFIVPLPVCVLVFSVRPTLRSRSGSTGARARDAPALHLD